jgi:WD40 repeat protein
MEDTTGGVRCLAFADDGTLALGGDFGRLCIWDPATGQQRVPPAEARGHAGAITGLGFLPGGKRVFTVSLDGTLLLWDRETVQPELSLPEPRAPDASRETQMKLWNEWHERRVKVEGVPILAIHSCAVAFVRPTLPDPGPEVIAIADEEGTVRVVPLLTLLPEMMFTNGAIQPASRRVTCRTVSPDGKTEVRGRADKVVLLGAKDAPGEARVLRGHGGSIVAVAFSRDGDTFASSSAMNWHQGINGQLGQCQVKLWNSATSELLADWRDEGAPGAVAVSPAGSAVAMGSGDRALLWKRGQEKPWRSEALGGPVVTLTFSADGTRLAVGTSTGVVTVWELSDMTRSVQMKGHENAVHAVAFAPDGRTLATAGEDHTVRLWQPVSGRLLMVLSGHTGPVKRLHFEDDGMTLVSEGPERRYWRGARPDNDK